MALFTFRVEPLTNPSWRGGVTLPYDLCCLRSHACQDSCAGFCERRLAGAATSSGRLVVAHKLRRRQAGRWIIPPGRNRAGVQDMSDK